MRKKRNFFCFEKNKNFSENLFSDLNFILKNSKTLIQKKIDYYYQSTLEFYKNISDPKKLFYLIPFYLKRQVLCFVPELNQNKSENMKKISLNFIEIKDYSSLLFSILNWELFKQKGIWFIILGLINKIPFLEKLEGFDYFKIKYFFYFIHAHKLSFINTRHKNFYPFLLKLINYWLRRTKKIKILFLFKFH